MPGQLYMHVFVVALLGPQVQAVTQLLDQDVMTFWKIEMLDQLGLCSQIRRQKDCAGLEIEKVGRQISDCC